MFRPNIVAGLMRAGTRDIHSRISYGAAVRCPCAIVNLDVESLKTSVRADSSASRGSADEIVSKAKILVVTSVAPKIGDKFLIDGLELLISATHTRRRVSGQVDHIECGLEMLP